MPAIRLSDRVAQQLLELIQSTQLQSGAKLPTERALAEQLGVSRTALREAIQKLASRGVLESRVGAGTFVGSRVPLWHEQAVAPLESLLRDDPQYRYDVLEARQALELSTAWYAAQRATDKDRDRIRRCFDDMLRHQQARDAASAARSDAQFHLAIAEASHNAVLVQLMGSLFELVLGTVAQNRRLMFVHDDLSTLEHLTAQHHNLMQAIVDGEPEQARAPSASTWPMFTKSCPSRMPKRPDASGWIVSPLPPPFFHDHLLHHRLPRGCAKAPAALSVPLPRRRRLCREDAGRNVDDLADVALRQRVLKDMSQLDTSIELFGEKFSIPVALAPWG
jgi:GntR family L-lactate dehydrogenase operon transcriptional regulator